MTSRAVRGDNSGLASAYAAARARLGLVLALWVLAALGWIWAGHAMSGMDAGPWTSLGSITRFLGLWVVMMAAMMLPAVAPTIALFTRLMRRKNPFAPWLFAAGYLLAWAAAGVLAYLVGALVSTTLGGGIHWDPAGRLIAAATLVLAAAYELTPLKDVCLATCRSPLAALLGSWRDGPIGAVRMGMRNGAWCVGCCWALMVSLFALGLMSLSWMALVAGLITLEKTLPWRHVTLTVAGVLVVLGVLLLTAPGALPWLTIPGATMSAG